MMDAQKRKVKNEMKERNERNERMKETKGMK